MYEKAYDKIWKGLTTKTNWIIKQYDSTDACRAIDEYSENQ
jgi:hypothetical protein